MQAGSAHGKTRSCYTAPVRFNHSAMRRAFVIFLILLFPLNVLALTVSVSSMQQTGAIEHVMAPAPADGIGQGGAFDLDPDEPPSGMDFHDTVNEEGQPLLAVPSDGSVAPRVPPRRGLAPFPPIKPPPVL